VTQIPVFATRSNHHVSHSTTTLRFQYNPSFSPQPFAHSVVTPEIAVREGYTRHEVLPSGAMCILITVFWFA